MHRSNLLRLFALTAFFILTLTAVSLTGDGPRPAEAAVGKLQYSLGCTDNHRASIVFYWYSYQSDGSLKAGGAAGARQVWIDASTSLGYWDSGTFTSAGPFAASDSTYEWRGLASSTTYYFRINQQLSSGGWDPSETYSIPTESCL